MKLFDILPNKSGKVRTQLCTEDVMFIDWEVLNGFDIVQRVMFDGDEREILFFSYPYRIPRFNKFYASRIKSINDPYLLELVKRLIYLNPHPDTLLIKKLTEHIVMNFSLMEEKPSEVAIGKLIATPVLKFEQVEPVVRAMSLMLEVIHYLPDNEDVIMFSREANMSRGDKISFRAKARNLFVSLKLEQVIHTVAEHLIDVESLTKVTGTRIENTNMVTTHSGPASVRTIRKYMSPRTKKVIDEHNHWAPFRTSKSQNKYLDYLTLPPGYTLEEIVEELGISKATAIEFRNLSSTVGIG